MALKGSLHILLIINCMAIVKCSVIDACFLQHVNITSEPVTITSTRREDRQDIINGCTMDLYVQEGNALSIEILTATLSNTYSYLYFGDLNSSNSQCLKTYISITLNSIPCNTTLTAYTASRMYLRSAFVTLKLKGVNVAIQECPESRELVLPRLPFSDDSTISRCDVSAYDFEVILPASHWNFNFKCPKNCKCLHLSYRKLSILCNGISAEGLLVYDQKNPYLSFRSIGLTTISSNALFGIHSVKFFYFTSNRLTTLDAGTFKGLSQMLHLALDYNHLSFLPATLFHDLVNLKSFVLTENRLSELPIDIFQNTPNLVSIRLQANELITLGHQPIAPNNTEMNMTHVITYKSILSGLVSMQYLNLRNNMLTSLSKGTFDDMVDLRRLDLSINPLHMLPGDTFSTMGFLKEIFLTYMHLTSLPYDTFRGNSELSVIHLFSNRLTSLPDSIFHGLKILIFLDLSKNSLHVLPYGLFKDLHRILTLYVFKNKLQQLLKYTFNGMFALQVLQLQLNELTSLPRGIFKDLISLDQLNLYSNRLKTLPADTFHSLSRLTSLDLNDNEFIVFTVNNTLPNLQSLNLNNNSLASLSYGDLSGMFLLEVLYIEHNNLVFMTNNTFSDLSQVTELYLGYNRLSTLPQGVLTSLVHIVRISLIGNLFTTLSGNVFTELLNLQRIELTNNKLTALPVGVFTVHDSFNSSLYELYLGDNQLDYLPSGLFSDLNTLSHLHLHNNNLTKLPSDIFEDLFELFELDLSYNYLHTFTEGIFQSLSKVHNMFVERNQVSDLPFTIFDNMTSMTYLDMAHNRLTNMHKDVFQSLHSLKFLNISNNYLYQLPRLDSLTRLQVLDIGFNQLSSLNPNSFRNNTNIIYLSLDSNAIFTFSVDTFQNLQNLQVLTCTNNKLNSLPPGVFGNLTSLISLILSYNHLSDISGVLWGLSRLEHLEIQQNMIHALPAGIFDQCKSLKFINSSTNSINTIGRAVFNVTNIQTLDLRSNSLKLVTESSFTKLQGYTVLVDESATCCFADNVTCISENAKPVYLTCRRILNETLLQISMWSLGLFTIVFNMLVFFIRCLRNQSSKIQRLLISHLSLSDFLMGVNMLLLAAADVIYSDFFPSYSNQWRNGPFCKVASILSILSSELSVFLITLISFDRFQGIKYPFSNKRLRPKSAKICLTLIWCVGLILSVVPTALSDLFPDVYEVSEVCVGIPIVKRPNAVSNDSFVEILVNETDIGYTYLFDIYTNAIHYNYIIVNTENLILSRYTFSIIVGYKLATYFSIVVFIGINLVCFGLVAFFYVQIFIYARKSSRSAGRKRDEKQEIRRAMKMSVIVLTDFCTWVPLLVVCILAQSNVIQVNPLTYAWTVAFILPINSAINPFLYTLIMLIEERNK